MADRGYRADPRDLRYDTGGRPQAKTYSWAPIIVFLLLFWPVGIVLLVRKMKNERSALLKNGKVVFGIGIFLAVMAVCCLISYAEGGLTTAGGQPYPPGSLAGLLLFTGGGGVALILVGNKMRRNGLKYKRYINLVVNRNMTSMMEISSAMGISYDQTVADLQKMQEDGYFSRGVFDFSGGRFYRNEDVRDACQWREMAEEAEAVIQSVRTNSAPSTPREEQKTAGVKVVVCKSCGANNTIPAGTVGECEYCGAPIR